MKYFFAFIAAMFLSGCGCSVVDPGNRGVLVTLGEVDNKVYPEGLVWHKPLVATVYEVSLRTATGEVKAECYSSDLQQVTARIKVMYRLPEENVLNYYKQYQVGAGLDNLIAPRIQEAFKESTSTRSAEQIVKEREQVKFESLAATRKKIGTLFVIEDLVIENLDLSKDLEAAIEAKMVQQQEAAKAEFTKQKAKVEAETAAIRAEGEAKALQIQGEALKKNPETMQMEMIKKWNGVTPLVVGGGSGTNILLPLNEKK